MCLTVLIRGGGGGSADGSDRLPDQTEEDPRACRPRQDPVRVLPQKLLCGGPRARQDDSRRSVNRTREVEISVRISSYHTTEDF